MMRVVTDLLSALVLTATTIGLRFLADRWLGPLQPFAPGFGVIAVAVWFLGVRTAAMTAVLCYLAGTFFFVLPRGHVPFTQRVDAASLLAYSVTAGLIIFIGGRARRAERELQRVNARLREADRNKDTFLATLSHELRNPLATMLSAAAALERLVEGEARRTVEVFQRQCRHMKRLVDDMLDVERVARGLLTLDLRAVDLRGCVEEAVEAVQDAATRKQQELFVLMPESPVIARVDGARVVQILVNLLDNASKYSRERAEIRISLSDQGLEAVLVVADTGPGIDLASLGDSFTPDGKILRSRAPQGLGIGLGLCRRLVDLHAGSMTLKRPTTAGQGTTWVIGLPVAGPHLKD